MTIKKSYRWLHTDVYEVTETNENRGVRTYTVRM